MTTTQSIASATPETPFQRLLIQLHLTTVFAVLLLMMLAGIAMRATQGTWLNIPPHIFYQLMTVHGAGMVGIAGLAGATIMWYFLRRHVVLTPALFATNFVLFLLGVVLILASIFLGGFGAGWTFLYPLPAKPMGIWSSMAAAGFILGLLVIGVGFLILNFDVARGLLGRYGNLWRSLGADQLFSGKIDASHPPTVVASTMVLIINTIGTLSGAVVLVMSLVTIIDPKIMFDPLLAKNLIYFFGHVFINASIYMAVIAVYELLPYYAGRPWKISRPFLAAWFAATIMVMAVYPHHLLMDAVMPKWALITGQVLSYLSGIPVLLVTTYGALMLIWRSNIRWGQSARFLVLSMFGWSIGVIPAIVDATISINKVMHNTLWVPGHFHLYLLLGLLPMVIGFTYHITRNTSDTSTANDQGGAPVFWLYTLGGLVFSGVFLFSGWHSLPRRWAEHAQYFPAAVSYDQFATIFAGTVIAAMLVIVVSLLARLPRLRLSA